MGTNFNQAVVFDSFDRGETDTWGTALSGQAWRPASDANLDANGLRGTIVVPQNDPLTVRDISTTARAWQEVLCLTFETTTDGAYFGVALRTNTGTVNGDGYLYVVVDPVAQLFRVGKKVGGTVTELTTGNIATPFVEGGQHWLRVRVSEANGIQARIWQRGSVEPGTWHVTQATIPSDVNATGYVGVATKGSASGASTVYYYTFAGYDVSYGEMPPLPVNDTFSRSNLDNWGMSDSHHAWEGHFARDPRGYVLGGLWYGSVSSGLGSETTTATAEHLGLIGPRAKDVRVRALIIDASGNDHEARVLARNTISYGSGLIDSIGYCARIKNNATGLHIEKRSSPGGAWTSLANAAMGFTFNPGTQDVWVKIECEGTTIRAKAWRTTDSEPGSWTVTTTDSEFTDGQSGIAHTPPDSTSRTFSVSEFYAEDITTAAGTTLSTLVTSTVVDDSVNLRAQYTGDSDNDNTISWDYKLASAEAWTASAGTGTRVSGGSPKYWDKTISSLTPGATYDFRAKITDPEGAVNAERWVYLFGVTTPINRLTTETLTLTASGETAIDVKATYTGDQDQDSTALVEYKLTSEPTIWTNAGAAAADRGNLWFTKTISGLSPSTSYDVRVTFTDADGVVGTNPLSSSVTTSKVTTLSTMTTSSILDDQITVRARYTNDSDNDNTVAWEYKATSSGTWIPLAGTGTRDTSGSPKYWWRTVSGLTPNTSYDFRTMITDPDGVTGGATWVTLTVSTTLNRLTTGTLTPVASGATAIDVTATYTGDNDDDSSALVEYKLTSEPTIWTSGGAMTADRPNKRFTATLSGLTAGETYDVRVTYSDPDGVLGTNPLTSSVLTSQVTTPLTMVAQTIGDNSVTLRARYDHDSDNDNTIQWEYKLTSEPTTWTPSAGTGTRQSGGSPKYWEKTISGLAPGTSYDFRSKLSDADGVVGGEVWVTLTVTTTFVMVATGSLILEADGTTILATATYTGDSDQDSSASIEYKKQSTGTWTSGGGMLADYPLLKFTATLTGLDANTVYDVRVTYADPDGVSGTNPLVGAVTTLGLAVEPVVLVAVPTATTVTLKAQYDWDINDNSTCGFQWRDVRSTTWTTVSASEVAADRVNEEFRVVLSGLRPSTSYEARALFSDPDGIQVGATNPISAVFTTLGDLGTAPEYRSKTYVWKVYNWQDEYVGTWPEAGEPNFQKHENGGVTDLSVKLFRSLSEIDTDPTIDFGNRVDVWALDYRSDGMGRNLINDSDFELGSWTLGANAVLDATGGPDGSQGLKIVGTGGSDVTTTSEVVSLVGRVGTNADGSPREVVNRVPLVVTCLAQAKGGKLELGIGSYDDADDLLETSDDVTTTVGTGWQRLRIVYLPHPDATYVRLRLTNRGNGTYFADKVAVRPQEMLVYRGKVEGFDIVSTADEESVTVEVLGLVASLTDDYIPFLQYVTIQPQRDAQLHPGENEPPSDPSNMLKDVIDIAQAQNPRFPLYYTSDSIKLTGTVVEYTFRDAQVRTCFDKIRALAPTGWFYFVEPDGLVWFGGPEHVITHRLRLNVEVMGYRNRKTVQGLKNVIVVRGRQDEDNSELDGFGTIRYVAQDPSSIDRHGRRVLPFRDASIKDPNTAELVGEGRLAELSVPEQRAELTVPDEKDLVYTGKALRGANIEQFRPGDMVSLINPVSGGHRTYWDEFVWDTGTWDDTGQKVLPDEVPIVTVQYIGSQVKLQLSERPPSAVADFARFARFLQLQEINNDEDRS